MHTSIGVSGKQGLEPKKSSSLAGKQVENSKADFSIQVLCFGGRCESANDRCVEGGRGSCNGENKHPRRFSVEQATRHTHVASDENKRDHFDVAVRLVQARAILERLLPLGRTVVDRSSTT